ncbi:MAG: ribonuclease P protein component [Gemmatimonadetes bacterium]|nr:MAG: ribonuclease P protein component [Gemmatimonadota bacterium]
MISLRFSKRQRLTKPWQFDRVYRDGSAYHYRFFVAFVLRTTAHQERKVGIVASRKVGKAVARNYAKRRLREIYRLHQHDIPLGTEIVLVARKTITSASWQQIQTEFLDCINHLQSATGYAKDSADSSI